MYPAQQNATDQTANFFWMLVLITIAVLAAWWLAKDVVVKYLFFIRYYEIRGIQYVVHGWNYFAHVLKIPGLSEDTLNYWKHFMTHSDLDEVAFADINSISHEVGRWIRYPIVGILLTLSTWIFMRSKHARFQHTYTMESLKKSEVQNWPQISPVINLNLLNEDLDAGPWAMAQLPLDFCKSHHLLELTQSKDGKKIWALKVDAAERLFVLQMGSLWQGVETLPIHIKALLVIFLAQAHRNHEIARRFISQIAESSQSGKLNFTGVQEYLKKYADSKIIYWLEKRHAYVGTFMASLLEIARAEGVLATAEFLWLKPVDRKLWYLLNTVGRQTAVVEVSGLFAHWLAEKRLKHPLRMPMVRQAVIALENSVNEILYIGEEEKWPTINRAA